MLKGYDTSHHQNDSTFLEAVNNCDFMIIKATEGKSWVDSKFKERASMLNVKGMLNGFYHYARPDNNTASQEAEHFYNTIKAYLNNKSIIVLDWEGKALNYPFEWALNFCQIMQQKTNRPCIIYASASVVRKYADKYFHWWTAHYNKKCEDGCTHDNVSELMVQYTSTPIDCDTFLGTEKEWLLLCGNIKETTTKILCEWIDGNKHYKLIVEE